MGKTCFFLDMPFHRKFVVFIYYKVKYSWRLCFHVTSVKNKQRLSRGIHPKLSKRPADHGNWARRGYFVSFIKIKTLTFYASLSFLFIVLFISPIPYYVIEHSSSSLKFANIKQLFPLISAINISENLSSLRLIIKNENISDSD